MSTPEPTGRRNRGLKQSVGDMLRSMVVVLAVGVVAVVGVANNRGRGTNLGKERMKTKLKQKFEHKPSKDKN